MEKRWAIAGFVLLILAIMLGAFGAHALKQIVHDPEKLQSFETGVRYQLFHGLACLAMVYIAHRFQLKNATSFKLILLGIIFFSGSIYLLTLGNILETDSIKKIVGPITPIGGVLLILGWTMTLIQVLRSKAH